MKHLIREFFTPHVFSESHETGVFATDPSSLSATLSHRARRLSGKGPARGGGQHPGPGERLWSLVFDLMQKRDPGPGGVVDVPQGAVLCVTHKDVLPPGHLDTASVGRAVAALVPLGLTLCTHRVLP